MPLKHGQSMREEVDEAIPLAPWLGLTEGRTPSLSGDPALLRQKLPASCSSRRSRSSGKSALLGCFLPDIPRQHLGDLAL